MVLIQMGPQNECGSQTNMEPSEEWVESLTARRNPLFNNVVSCYIGIAIIVNTCQDRTIRLTNLISTLLLCDCVWMRMNFELFLIKWLLARTYISASIVLFFNTRTMLLWTPSVGSWGVKVEGMDREGLINHDTLILPFALLKWMRLEGLILGIEESWLPPRVNSDDIFNSLGSVISRCAGGRPCWLFWVQKSKATSKASDIPKLWYLWPIFLCQTWNLNKRNCVEQ